MSARRRAALVAPLLAALAVLASPMSATGGPAPDAIDDALALASLSREDLGWEARGWWERYPADIPGKLRHFDDLCAQPLAVAPFVRAMGSTLRLTLAPDVVSRKEGDPKAGALYRAVHDLGVNKRFGGTRAYSANLGAKPTPLHVALVEAWRVAGRETTLITFGQESPYPKVPEDLASACAGIPEDVSDVLGQLTLNLLDARRWATLAFRRVPLETRVAAAARLDLGEKETDALDFDPALDDTAHAWDEASLWYAGLKTVEALDTARLALSASLDGDDAAARDRRRAIEKLRVEIVTPLGLVIIDGSGASRIDVGEGAFLVVDLGGRDSYAGALAGSSPMLPVAAALDLGGDDVYACGDRALGAGVSGVGVLLDAGGKDSYSSKTMGQGAGHFGLGALIDLGGDDSYAHQHSGQGAAFFGVGVLIDAAGSDSYTVWSDGQGFGGIGGVGVLADREGDDRYVAVVDPAVTGRPSYHSDGKISASEAQGVGMGRRGDGADGHSWAGGLGALLDAAGHDAYTAGNWAQGCGYWFGTGLLWDGGGDDGYRANGWASASGAHFCIGAVVDESGDDVHAVAQNWGPAFGHDFTVAVLVDASGDDRYEAGGDGIGFSINRSVALCLDGGGDDTHAIAGSDPRPGFARFDARFLDRAAPALYWTEPVSVGLFLDVGGDDAYPEGLDDGKALTDAPDSDNVRSRNRGIFVDRPAGAIDLERPQARGRPRDAPGR